MIDWEFVARGCYVFFGSCLATGLAVDNMTMCGVAVLGGVVVHHARGMMKLHDWVEKLIP